MKKILFISKEQALVAPTDFGKAESTIAFYPKVFQYLSRIVRELDYQLVVLTSKLSVDERETLMAQAFKNEEIEFLETINSENITADKVSKGSFKYFAGYNMAESFVISCEETHRRLVDHLGCQQILFSNEKDNTGVLATSNWEDIYRYLKLQPRTAKVNRVTSETSIEISINLDGKGQSKISTGLAFFDHMLDQIARHGNIDLSISAAGDLHIDEHHTIEDIGLALGEAFLQALGSKKAIARYGFLLPMDDCLAQMAIDFGGRPWLVWDAEFKREKIGDMPTEMFIHFFKSFSDTAKCNLNIKAEGDNEHHKIESIFKAFAKAISMAVQKTDNYIIPSTKGSL